MMENDNKRIHWHAFGGHDPQRYEVTKMKQLIVFLLLISFLAIAGCDRRSRSIPKGHFRVAIDNVIDHEEFVVTNIRIKFRGKRSVTVSRKDGDIRTVSGIVVEDQSGNSPSVLGADLVIGVALFKAAGAANSIKWYAQMDDGTGNTLGSVFGHPRTLPVEAETIRDILELSISEGNYPFDEMITIAQLQGDSIALKVK